MKKTLKKNQQALIAGLVLIALVVVYFKRDSLKTFFSKAVKPAPNKTSPTANNSPSTVQNVAPNDQILSKGSTGATVEKLQQLLNDKHRQNTPTLTPYLVVDGNFGSKTEAMLKKYTNQTSISINQLLNALK